MIIIKEKQIGKIKIREQLLKDFPPKELRGIIESTNNEDVLADRFIRALHRMGTWQEFFVFCMLLFPMVTYYN